MLAASSDAVRCNDAAPDLPGPTSMRAPADGETALGFASLRGTTPVREVPIAAGATAAPAPANPASAGADACRLTARGRRTGPPDPANRRHLPPQGGLRVVPQQHPDRPGDGRGAARRHRGQRGRRAQRGCRHRALRRELARARAAGARYPGRRRHGELYHARSRRREASSGPGHGRDGQVPQEPSAGRWQLAHHRSPSAARVERHHGDRAVDACLAALRAGPDALPVWRGGARRRPLANAP